MVGKPVHAKLPILYGAVVQLAGDKSLKMITVWFRIPSALPSWAGLTTSQVTG